ncbi:MAG: acyltransferase [Chitinophagaceae bacterium]|nr:acyltransferase [Chitinophagaceae bacterium]
MKIKPLTSLRFFFALMVFLRHSDFIFNHEQFRNTHNPVFTQLYDSFFAEGYVGVSFFFMLSGFILCLNYKDKLINDQISLKDFWVARMARIYPLHLFTLLIAIPVSFSGFLTGKFFWLGKLVMNVFLLQSFVPDNEVYFAFNGTAWSISDELFFYLLFPFLVMAFFKYGRSFRLGMYVLPLMIPVGIYFAPDTIQHHFFYINPMARVVDFLIGILLYHVYEKLRPGNFFQSKWAATFTEIAAVGLFALFFVFHNDVEQGYRYSCYYWIPIAIVLLVFAQQAGYLSTLLSNKVLVLAGEISFSFYLLHQLVFKYLSFINARFFIIHSELALIAIIFVVSAVASYVSYYFVELPANSYIKEKYRLLSTPAAAVSIAS